MKKIVENKSKKGISLIVLIITIIIMIVLAGTIILTLVNSGIIGQTRMGVFKNNVANYKAELQMFIADASLKNQITVYGETVPFEVDKFSRDENLIQEYIKSMSDIDAARFLIIQGNLVYIADDTLFTAEEMTALDEIGVRPSEYTYAENIGVFEDGEDYTGERIYVNPRPTDFPDDEVMYMLSYTNEDNMSVIMYVPEDIGEDVLAFIDIQGMYQYIPAGTKHLRSDMQGLLIDGHVVESTGSEEITFKRGGWVKVEMGENDEVSNICSILPENLPVVIGKGPVGAFEGNIGDIGNYASFEPYVVAN